MLQRGRHTGWHEHTSRIHSCQVCVVVIKPTFRSRRHQHAGENILQPLDVGPEPAFAHVDAVAESGEPRDGREREEPTHGEHRLLVATEC